MFIVRGYFQPKPAKIDVESTIFFLDQKTNTIEQMLLI